MARLTLGVASTFPPREDGIATFTRDLLKGVRKADVGITTRIAAITERGSSYAYLRQVRWEIEQDHKASYAAAGRALSRAKVTLVSLQHEFGLWGDAGDLATLFDQYDCAPAFLDALDRPVVTTLHTVLSKPRADLRAAIRLLCARSAATTVMVGVGAKILAEDYDVDPTRLVVIPHGVPEVRAVDKERIKRRLRLSGHTVVSTFGLLTRNKGIETAIRALPEVVARHPNVLSLIMGETHRALREPVPRRSYVPSPHRAACLRLRAAEGLVPRGCAVRGAVPAGHPRLEQRPHTGPQRSARPGEVLGAEWQAVQR